MLIVLDTETSGFKTNHIIQYASVAVNDEGVVYEETNVKFKLPEGVKIEEGATKCHGIKDEDLKDCNHIEQSHLQKIIYDLNQAKRIVGHNIDFDLRMVKTEYERHKSKMPYINFKEIEKKAVCTMKETTNYCKIPHTNRAGYKWPKLQELHKILFGENFKDAHDALADVMATYKCLKELVDRDIII